MSQLPNKSPDLSERFGRVGICASVILLVMSGVILLFGIWGCTGLSTAEQTAFRNAQDNIAKAAADLVQKVDSIGGDMVTKTELTNMLQTFTTNITSQIKTINNTPFWAIALPLLAVYAGIEGIKIGRSALNWYWTRRRKMKEAKP